MEIFFHTWDLSELPLAGTGLVAVPALVAEVEAHGGEHRLRRVAVDHELERLHAALEHESLGRLEPALVLVQPRHPEHPVAGHRLVLRLPDNVIITGRCGIRRLGLCSVLILSLVTLSDEALFISSSADTAAAVVVASVLTFNSISISSSIFLISSSVILCFSCSAAISLSKSWHFVNISS